MPFKIRMKCKKCVFVDMKPGKYIENTYTCGIADFPGDREGRGPGKLNRGQTMYPAGPGTLKTCLKCPRCGWSCTVVEEEEDGAPAPDTA